MPKICCFFVKLEEIKKKLNKIRKLMGETFQNFKAYGKSVVVERQKNIVIERSDDNIITRKQTIIREKILNDANTLSPSQKPQDLKVTTPKTQPITSNTLIPDETDQIVNSKRTILSARTTTTTTTASPLDNIYLPDSTKAFSASELASLKQDIDEEIANLKLQRSTLLQRAISTARENAKMREKKPVRTQIQNDMTWGQNFTSPKPAETIQLQFEKFSSEHNVQTAMRQPKRDEQTSCRPRMRTIGLQKNTQRSSSTPKPDTSLPLHKSLLNLQYNSTCETIPNAFGCFDYGPSCHPANPEYCYQQSHSHSGCQSYCQRFNISGDYNGLVCNRNTYCHAGCTPCSEYNYCHDEYYYDYSNMQSPQQHTHIPKSTACCCRTNSRPTDQLQHRKKITQREHKRDKATHKDQGEEEKNLLTKNYLLQQITKQQRELEREGARALALKAAQLKLERSNRKEHRGEKLKDENEVRINALFTRSRGASKKLGPYISDDSDTGDQRYHLKQERLKVTKKRSYKLQKQPSSNNDCGDYEDISSDATSKGFYNYKTKRTLERMNFHSYRPKQKQSETHSDIPAKNGKGVKKENRYDDYITQYKTDPLGSKIAANKSIQTSVGLVQQEYQINRLESVADEPGLRMKATDPKSTQTSYITTPKSESNSPSVKRVSAHDGNERWESPVFEPQPKRVTAPPQDSTKDHSAQTDAQTSKPVVESIKRSSSVNTSPQLFVRSDQVQNETKQSDMRAEKMSSPLGGSFFSREDAYQKASKKTPIPMDVSPFELLAIEESLSQDTPGQSPQEQFYMRDHLFRGEYQPDRSSTDDKVPKVDDSPLGMTSDKEYLDHNLTYVSSREMEHDQAFVEMVPQAMQYSQEQNLQNFNIEGGLTDTKHSNIPVSKKLDSQNGRPPIQSLSNNEKNQNLPKTPETRSPREGFRREESFSSENRKLSTLSEHPTQENITKDRSYSEEEEKPSTAENLRREGSYVIETHNIDPQEERSVREDLPQQSSYIPKRNQSIKERQPSRDRSSLNEQILHESHDSQKPRSPQDSYRLASQAGPPQENKSVERNHLPDRQKRNTQERQPSLDRSPRVDDNSLKKKQSQRGSFDTQERQSLRDSQKRTSKEQSPLESLSAQRSDIPERKSRSTQERKPSQDRENNEENGSLRTEQLRRDSLDSQKTRSSRDNQHQKIQKPSQREHSPRNSHNSQERQSLRDSQRRTSNEQSSPESLSAQRSDNPERKRSTQERKPSKDRENREENGSLKTEQLRRDSVDSQNTRSSRDSQSQKIQETSQREHLLKEENDVRGLPTQSFFKQKSGPTEEDAHDKRRHSKVGSFTRESQIPLRNTTPREKSWQKEDLNQKGYFSREGSFVKENQALLDESVQINRPKKAESVPAKTEDQTLRRESSPRKSLAKEKSFERAQQNAQDITKLLPSPEGSFQDHRKRSLSVTSGERLSQQVTSQNGKIPISPAQRSPRQSLMRETSFTMEKLAESNHRGSFARSFDRDRQDSFQSNLTADNSKKNSIDKNNQEKLTINQKPQSNRFKDSVREKVIPQTRLARKSADEQGVKSAREEPDKSSQQLHDIIPTPIPVVEIVPPSKETNVDDSLKESTPIPQLNEGFLRSIQDQPRRSSKREESSFTANQLRQDSTTDRRRSRDGSFAVSTQGVQGVGESLTSQKRLSNTPNYRTSTHKDSIFSDVQNFRNVNDHATDHSQTIPRNISPISSQRRRSSQPHTQSPRWTKEEVFYPHMDRVHGSQQSNILRFSKLENKIQYHPSSPKHSLEHFADETPTRNYPRIDDENRLYEVEGLQDLAESKYWQNKQGNICPNICPEICMDIPHPYISCEDPEPTYQHFYGDEQAFHIRNNNYDQLAMRTPINTQVYQQNEMVYDRDFDPFAGQCPCPCPYPCPCPHPVQLQDNTYDEQVTTTTVSSQASCSETAQPLRRTEEIFNCLNSSIVEQHQLCLQQEQPDFFPIQQFESDEDYLQQLDLKNTRFCCDEAEQQENVFCNDNCDDARRLVDFDLPYMERNDDFRCREEMNQDFEYEPHYEPPTHIYLQKLPSDCTITSAYATASSGLSYTNLGYKKEVEESPQSTPSSSPACHCQASTLNLATIQQNRLLPKYTGCPCMLGTYMEMMGLTAAAGTNKDLERKVVLGNEMPSKDKEECVKRISFR